MTGTRRAMVAVVLFVGFGAGLGGCGGDEDPVADPPSPTSSTASSSSPTGTASGGSGSASATPSSGKVTEEQFIARWIQVHNQMFATGKNDEFLAMATKQCDSCFGLAKAIKGYYASGGSVHGGAMSRLRDIHRSGTWDNQDRFAFTVTTAASEVRDASGKILQSYSAAPRIAYYMVLKPDRESWKIIHLGQAPR